MGAIRLNRPFFDDLSSFIMNNGWLLVGKKVEVWYDDRIKSNMVIFEKKRLIIKVKMRLE